jgi:hypothetical protein
MSLKAARRAEFRAWTRLGFNRVDRSARLPLFPKRPQGETLRQSCISPCFIRRSGQLDGAGQGSDSGPLLEAPR